MSATLALYVSPKVSFMADVPGSCEMVELLKIVHVLELARSNQACPKTVPSCSVTKSKTSNFECVDYTVVGVRRVVDPKC